MLIPDRLIFRYLLILQVLMRLYLVIQIVNLMYLLLQLQLQMLYLNFHWRVRIINAKIFRHSRIENFKSDLSFA